MKNLRTAAKVEAQEVFAWTRQISYRIGAEYEVWTGTDPELARERSLPGAVTT
ncbi:hypothetical protein [Williamsia muralis]|uniref:hypothetical protein n=1 Tax=Williamsia marianensis TaxID=85044 RepID=UPI000A95AE14|nr:hypothetical protein [Williamsia muralis]